MCVGRKSNAEKMGKKGSWFSTIKRVFVHDSKDKPSPYVRVTFVDLLLVIFRVDIRASFHSIYMFYLLNFLAFDPLFATKSSLSSPSYLL